jgi:hypothetical protein
MLKPVRTLTIAAAFLTCAMSNASAQTGFTAADEKEMNSYRLTMPAVKKWEASIRYMAEWVRTNPEAQAHIKLQGEVDALRKKDERTDAEQERLEKLEQRLEAMESSDDDDKDQSITEMAAEITKFKPVADAIQRAGFAPREYVVFSFALFQAHAYASMKKSGMATDIPKGLNAENIKFAETHAAEITRLHAEMEKVSKGLEGVMKKDQ